MTHHLGQRAAPAPYVLPAGFAVFLAVGTAAAALHGRLTATGVLVACALVAFASSFAAEPVASVLLAGIGWLTVVGFSRPRSEEHTSELQSRRDLVCRLL